MYTSLFKLKELPFRLSPDPAFLFLSAHHARAKAYMESTIWFQDGFVIITGEIGAGKTTLIETFLQELDQEVIVAQINQTQVSPTEFLQAVLVQFGYTPFNMKKAELIATLNNFLIEQYASGRKVLLIVDEAQNLSLRVLEEVRMLSGVETTKEKVLRIILAGQPELNAKLDSPELIQLAQRVRLRFHLTPLSEEDSRAYVLHRLEIAGAAGRTIFADSCFPLLFRYTGGVPRLINTICETAMIAAYGEDRDRVTPGDLRKAIAELRWVDYATRTATDRSMVAGHAPTTADVPDRAWVRVFMCRPVMTTKFWRGWWWRVTMRSSANCRCAWAALWWAVLQTTICRSTAGWSVVTTARSSPHATRASSKTSTAPTALQYAASACGAWRCAMAMSSSSAGTNCAMSMCARVAATSV